MNRLINFILVIISMSLLFTDCTQKHTIKLEWKLAGELPQSIGVAGPVTGVNNNMLLVAGGSNFPDSMPWLGGKKKYYADGYVFKKDTNDSLIHFKSFQLPFALAYSANCSTEQGIVAAGGENESGISNTVLMMQWNEENEAVTIKNLPDLPFAVTNAAISSKNNKIYLAGGETAKAVSDKFLMLDLNDTAKGWQQLPHLPYPVSHAVMLIQSNGKNDCIYLIGGRKKNAGDTSDLYASVFQFDLNKQEWLPKQSLLYALSAGTGIAAGNHFIILFGGDKGATFHQTEAIIAAINKETDEVKKQELIKQKIQLQSSHPGFSKEILAYNTVENKWTEIGFIPFNVPATTTAVKWGDEVLIPGGEIRAGVRTPQILMAKIEVKTKRQP